MSNITQKLIGLSGVLLATGLASAQNYSVDHFTIAGGSGTVTGGAFVISGTVGQPEANLALSGGAFSLTGGFWSEGAVSSDPKPLIVPGTANPWLAGMPDGFHEANGDVAPDQSPVLFTNFTAKGLLHFVASGSAGYSPGSETGPSGITGFFVNHA